MMKTSSHGQNARHQLNEGPLKGEKYRIVAPAFTALLLLILSLLLPLDQASSVDKNPEIGLYSITEGKKEIQSRGKILGAEFNGKDLYKTYKEVETEYHDKAFRQNNKWKTLAKRQDVEVSILEHPEDHNCPYVKMVGIIPTSVENCWEWLSLENWPRNMPKMDPFYEGLDLHGDYNFRGVNMKVARKRMKKILTFGKRDIVFLSVSDKPLRDGTWVSGSISVETSKVPREKGYIRAFQDSIAFYKPIDDNTKTRITIVCRIDLNDSTVEGDGGWIPMWIYVKTVGPTALRSVINMRNEIVNDAVGNLNDSVSAKERPDKKKAAIFGFWKKNASKRTEPR